MANTAKDGEDGHGDMETTGKNKTVQPTPKTVVPNGLNVLARLIAREEISRRGWGDTVHEVSLLDEMTEAMLRPVFKKNLVNE